MNKLRVWAKQGNQEQEVEIEGVNHHSKKMEIIRLVLELENKQELPKKPASEKETLHNPGFDQSIFKQDNDL